MNPREKVMTQADCDRRHGVLGKFFDYAGAAALAIGLAAFAWAASNGKDMGSVTEKSNQTEKRVDRLEGKIDDGFKQVIDAIRKAK